MTTSATKLTIFKYLGSMALVFVFFVLPFSNILAYDASIKTLGPLSVADRWARVGISLAVGDQANLVWIEYGPNSAMSSSSGSITVRPNFSFTNYDFSIGGLSPSTTYYYRGVSRNHTTGSTVYGNMMTLTTREIEVAPATLSAPTVGNSNTQTSGSSNKTSGSASSSGSSGSFLGFLFGGSSSSQTSSNTQVSPFVFSNTNSPFARSNNSKFKAGSSGLDPRVAGASSLTLEVISIENSKNSNDSVYVFSDQDSNLKSSDLGGELAYSVGYRNNSQYSLAGAGFKIIIPEGTKLVEVSKEPTRIVGNVIIFDLGEVKPGVQESIDVKVSIDKDATPGSTLVFTSVFEYKDNSGKLMSVTSYITALVKGVLRGPFIQSSMFAGIFGSYGILWLISFVLIILAGVLAYRYKVNSQVLKDKNNLSDSPSLSKGPEFKTIGSSAPSYKDEGFILPGYKVEAVPKK